MSLPEVARGKNNKPKNQGEKMSTKEPKKEPKKAAKTAPVRQGELEPKKAAKKAGEKLQRERDYSVAWLNPWMLETPALNDAVYGNATDDPGIDALAESLERDGVITPLLVNREGCIISGNRRRAAACRANFREVPCYVWDVPATSKDFSRLLVDANENRVKGANVQMAEIGVRGAKGRPEVWLGMQRIKAERRERYGGLAQAVEVAGRSRKAITRSRQLADAVVEAVDAELADGVVPTVRQIHYRLLNNPPVKDTQTGERYANDDASYKALTRIAARLRINGEISFDSIIDTGREVFMPPTYVDAGEYADRWMRWFGGDYRRNVMRSQPCFFAVVLEKEAMGEFFRRHIEAKYPGMAVAVCKGFASLSLAYQLQTAFRQSKKERMTLLAFSDCDPAGHEIVDDVGRKMLELGIREDEFTLARCGLTVAQAKSHGARPQSIKSKVNGGGKTKAGKYEDRTGTRDVYELEAIPPRALLDIMDAEMAARMDVAAYNTEIEAMPGDAKALMDAQRKLYSALKPGDCGK